MTRTQLTVLNPVATSQGDLRWYPLAPRDGSLAGKRIGLFWNHKRGGEIALKHVGEVLQQRYPDVEIRWYEDQMGASTETIARAARECQAVVGSTGD